MGVVTENGTFVGQGLTDAQAYKQFFDLKLEDRDHWRDRLWARVDAGELSEDEALDLIIQGTDDNLVTAAEEPLGEVRWPILRIVNGELVSPVFGPLSLYTDASKPDGQLASKQARAIVKYFEQRNTPSQIFYAFSDQACGCFGVTMNYKPETGEIMAVSKYYPIGIADLGKVFERLNSDGRKMVMVDGKEASGLLGWQIRIDKERDFIGLEEQDRVIGMVRNDGVTRMIMPEFKNPGVWLGWGAGIGSGAAAVEQVTMTQMPDYEESGVESVKPEAVIWKNSRDVVIEQPVTESHLRKVAGASQPAVTDLPRYEKPLVAQEEKILVAPVLIEVHPRGVLGLEEGVDQIAPAVTGTVPVSEVPERPEVTVTELSRYGAVSVSQEEMVDVHPGSVHGLEEAEKIVAPMVTRTVLVSEVREVPEREVTVVPTQHFGEIVEDVHSGSVHEQIEEVITEGTELTEGTEVVVFSAVSDHNSVSLPAGRQASVIGEVFNEQVTERKQYQNIKAKMIWLRRQVANVVADGLMGRWLKPKQDKPILAWLVYGMALIQFDSVDKSQFDGVVSDQMSQWRLSPVRVWADRVVGRVRRVKDKIMQTGWGVYKQLFTSI
jgi:hypothetical protein